MFSEREKYGDNEHSSKKDYRRNLAAQVNPLYCFPFKQLMVNFIYTILILCFMCLSIFEEKANKLEEAKMELQGRIEELEEETDHLKRQQLMEGEVKRKLREETSRLTAENMVCLCVRGGECVHTNRHTHFMIFIFFIPGL